MDVLSALINLKSSTMQVSALVKELADFSKLHRKFSIDHPVVQKRCPMLSTIKDDIQVARWVSELTPVIQIAEPDFPTIYDPTKMEKKVYRQGKPFLHTSSYIGEDVTCRFDNGDYLVIHEGERAIYIQYLEHKDDESRKTEHKIEPLISGEFKLYTYSPSGNNDYIIGWYQELPVSIPNTQTLKCGVHVIKLTEAEQSLMSFSLPTPETFANTIAQLLNYHDQNIQTTNQTDKDVALKCLQN